MKKILMLVGRVFAWLVMAAALMAAGAEVVASAEAGTYRGLAIGELWYLLDRESLNLSQAVTQRFLSPLLWDGVVVILLQPAWIVLGIAGPVLMFFFARRRNGQEIF